MSLLRASPRPAALVVSVLALAAVLAVPSPGIAVASAASTVADEASEQPSIPAQASGDEQGGSELPWLFAVFFLTWAAFFGYVFVMSRRQREMEQEIQALRRNLQEREPEAAGEG